MYTKHSEKIHFLTFAFPLIILSVFMIGYWPVFQKLFIRWSSGDNSYCYLIVPLFFYLLWDQRAKGGIKDYGFRGKDKEKGDKEQGLRIKGEGIGRRAEIRDQKSEVIRQRPEVRSQKLGGNGFAFGEFSWSPWGVVPVILSILLVIIGELGSVETLLYTGIWGCIVGMIFVLYGRRIRYLIFPLLILTFIVPLPPFINRTLTFQLKLAASKLSTAMLRVCGVSVLREGNIIDLGVSQLQVVDACSGLRYLMPLFLMALLVGYFFNKRLWQRAILIFVVVPLSIFVNSIRIWITGLLTARGYEKLAQSFFHDFSGWLIFMVAGGVLVAAALILKRIGHRFTQTRTDQKRIISHRPRQARNHTEDLNKPGDPNEHNDHNDPNHLNDPNDSNELNAPNAPNNLNSNQLSDWLKPALITAVLCFLFAGSGWAVKAIPSAKNLPHRLTFDSFPMRIGQWQGERNYISKDILDSLWADDYVSAVYSRPGSQNHINLLIPFYEYQGTRHTAHAPQSCMLGGGWALFNSGERPVNITPRDEIKIMTMTWEKENYKLLGSYFFLQRGRVITSPWMNKFYLMWDAFTKQRTDGALVRLEMTMPPGQSMEAAYGMLEEFIVELLPILPKYIPE